MLCEPISPPLAFHPNYTAWQLEIGKAIAVLLPNDDEPVANLSKWSV
jgi:hypothetical protein